ncbi:gpW family head-tail joining protein [Tranquillimonas rosea]|uniref:gpW family head-tail joining protein n=1 Tax=Tranquillimonas rosea TaxID=641238 RepID=UPI003BAD0463
MTDTATLRARLAEAEDALHKVALGGAVSVVSYDGSRTEYTPTSEAALRRYVRSLKRQLGDLSRGGGSHRVRF